MSFCKLTRNLGLSALAFLAMPLLVSAKPKTNNPQIEKTSIQLNNQATVDGKTLAPGKYEVMIDGKKASFERNGETVVTARCDWKTMDHNSPYDSTTISKNGVLQEIEFEGRNQALEIM